MASNSAEQSNTTFQLITEDLSKNLFNLQVWLKQVVQFPEDDEAFKARYGSFQDEQGVQTFVAAVANARQVAQNFGNPTTLKQQIASNPNLLMGIDPPKLVYGHLVWLFTQIGNAASTFESTLGSLQQLLEPSNTDQKTRAEYLKTILNGSGGLVSTANNNKSKTEILMSQISPFESQLSQAIQTFNETKLVNQANQRIGLLGSNIDQLKNQAAQAYKQWKGKTMPESVWSEPIESIGDDKEQEGLTMLWDRKKKNARKKYEQLRQEIDAAQAEVQQKSIFTNDLKDFFINGNRVVAAVLSINNNLKKINKVFGDTADRLTDVCNLSSEEKLSNYLWVARALEIPKALEVWKGIKDAAQNFVQNSLVS
ncbi:hypothetical protein [Anabaena azotica]|uniref:Uncharacterized protein n=1 Tax=Anabaena azotica FACHB-119 TaxID=947527 RepID=A0ABR8DHM0_9NOST|nr:hypothetical protein [Anabaena azotica]MBD2505581.1 hypothetical protein [Anabaena azotica FACHB-119]